MAGVGEDRTDPSPTRRRYTVLEASGILGLTVEAVRGRIKRDTLAHVKGEDGTVYVLLDDDRARPDADRSTDQARPDERAVLVEELRDRVRYLERVLEEERVARTEERQRHDTLMAQLMQRIPQIEAPSEPRESPPSPAPRDTPTEGREEPQEPAEPRRGFWSRLFGG